MLFVLLVVVVIVVAGGELGGLFLDLPGALKMGASRENFSSKWVHPQKTFAAKLMHQDKTLL